MKKWILAFLVVLSMCFFSGCAKKYRVDYCGGKDCFRSAKDSYAAGREVRLEYFVIESDTDYRFYLDGERLSPDFQNEMYIIRFTMPDHDVTLRCETENSMETAQ